VLTGTGRAAQIGRPVAGKTGTTSSNKDGWFVGFSSGLTTGVWMGRDDARPIAGLQGGTAPARAFHDFMTVAVARRPVVAFETQVPMPDWQLTPEEQAFGDTPVDQNAAAPMVDENGLPIGPPPVDGGPAPQQPMVRPDGSGEPSQQELDQAFPPAQQQQQPDPRSAPPPDPPEPRPFTP
jgi:penicillin-binding protein 1A